MFKVLMYYCAFHTYCTYLAYLQFNVYLLRIELHFVMMRDGFAVWIVRLVSAWVDQTLAYSLHISITTCGPIYQPSQNTTNTAHCIGVRPIEHAPWDWLG